MAEIIAAVDETGRERPVRRGPRRPGHPVRLGHGQPGPVHGELQRQRTLSSGPIDLIAPGTVAHPEPPGRLAVAASFGFDLSDVIPDFCLPRVCVTIPFIGRVCTPRICIDWPTVSIPVVLSDFVEASADLGLAVALRRRELEGQGGRAEPVATAVRAGDVGLLVVIGAAATAGAAGHPVHRSAAGRGGRRHPAGDRHRGPDRVPRRHPVAVPVPGSRSRCTTSPSSSRCCRPTGRSTLPSFITLDAVAAQVDTTTEDELVLAIDVSP